MLVYADPGIGIGIGIGIGKPDTVEVVVLLSALEAAQASGQIPRTHPNSSMPEALVCLFLFVMSWFVTFNSLSRCCCFVNGIVMVCFLFALSPWLLLYFHTSFLFSSFLHSLFRHLFFCPFFFRCHSPLCVLLYFSLTSSFLSSFLTSFTPYFFPSFRSFLFPFFRF